MITYLLDTSTASHVIRGDRPRIMQRVLGAPASSLAVSVLTEAELRYGVAKRGHPAKLSNQVEKFLLQVAILDWERDSAFTYAALRVMREVVGAPLAPMDLLIAAHAKSIGATLVTCDAAFGFYPAGLSLEDWSL
jgi:tRNA(fMet)-specific endonuclease VapC